MGFFNSHVVQVVTDTACDVVKELTEEGDRERERSDDCSKYMFLHHTV